MAFIHDIMFCFILDSFFTSAKSYQSSQTPNEGREKLGKVRYFTLKEMFIEIYFSSLTS